LRICPGRTNANSGEEQETTLCPARRSERPITESRMLLSSGIQILAIHPPPQPDLKHWPLVNQRLMALQTL
jgi:hypothetical protein